MVFMQIPVLYTSWRIEQLRRVSRSHLDRDARRSRGRSDSASSGDVIVPSTPTQQTGTTRNFSKGNHDPTTDCNIHVPSS